MSAEQRWMWVGVLFLSVALPGLAADSDGDGVDDLQDVCCNTPAATPVDPAGRPLGDFDLDCDNDLVDFAIYQQAFTGPLAPCVQPDGTPCDDGDPCTVGDTIWGGVCMGIPLMCDDFNGCTDDYCHEGSCLHVPNLGTCDDGNACTADDACACGECVGTPIQGCGPCTTDGDCADGDDCNYDFCVAGTCQHPVKPDNSPCDDGDECTGPDICIQGACQSTPLPNCGPCATHQDCDDSNACTDDQCVASQCQHSNQPFGFPCDDGDACTSSDHCLGDGTCDGTTIPSCGPCMTALECDDFLDCTMDQCVMGFCQHPPLPNGSPCDDNGGVSCVSGNCQ